MRLVVALAVATAASAVTAALIPHADAQTTSFRFQTPSRNIGCLYDAPTNAPSYIRCDILSGLKPAPKRACELDWTGFTMAEKSRATASCAGDTVYDRNARIFQYSRTWTRDGFTCTVQRVGLRCKNRTGHGFFLSRTRSYTF